MTERKKWSIYDFINCTVKSLQFDCSVVFYLKLGVVFVWFFCTEVVVYIDTSPYFCERQIDDVIGAEALEEAGLGGLVSYYQIFRKNYKNK